MKFVMAKATACAKSEKQEVADKNKRRKKGTTVRFIKKIKTIKLDEWFTNFTKIRSTKGVTELLKKEFIFLSIF